MISIFFPVNTHNNPFWTSDIGLECIDHFLADFTNISFIDQAFVISKDLRVLRLLEKHDTQALDIPVPGTNDRPYTSEETMTLAKLVRQDTPCRIDDLIIADHRSLSLSPEDLIKAHGIYRQNPDSSVVSVAYCKDHPCQYKAYFTFIGCAIFHMGQANSDILNQKTGNIDLSKNIHPENIDINDIHINLSINNNICKINFDFDFSSYAFFARILPFTEKGPSYDNSYEFQISGDSYDSIPNIIVDEHLKGMIITILMANPTGCYDTVECFTPENADWELGFLENKVVKKDDHTMIQGRQQFSEVYTYDGSFSFFHADKLNSEYNQNMIPIILNDSHIVCDWFDYWHSINNTQTSNKAFI